MKRIKKILISIMSILVLCLAPTTIYAISSTPAIPVDPCVEADDTAFCQDSVNHPRGGDPINSDSSPILGPNSLLYKIIQTVTILTGAISVIMIIIGGFRYIVSGGDPSSTKGAKDTILYAVIGLVIAIFAQTIITFVLSNL